MRAKIKETLASPEPWLFWDANVRRQVLVPSPVVTVCTVSHLPPLLLSNAEFAFSGAGEFLITVPACGVHSSRSFPSDRM